MPSCTRVLIDYDPFPVDRKPAPWDRGKLDASWISHPGPNIEPFFVCYELALDLQSGLEARIHVTADERYQLFVDDILVGRGSERGDADHWFYESYDLKLEPGKHTIRAVVWSLGDTHAPFAQFFIRHGFLLIAQNPELKALLTTGHAPWKCRPIEGIEMIPRTATFATGNRFRFIGTQYRPFGQGEQRSVIASETPRVLGTGDLFPVRLLTPSMLPNLVSKDWNLLLVRHIDAPDQPKTSTVAVRDAAHLAGESEAWQRLLVGESITIPAHSRRRVIIDCQTYVCSYWHLRTRGGNGSIVRLTLAESLYSNLLTNEKGNRNEIEGKFFGMVWNGGLGQGDEIRPGGADEQYGAYWWLAGRYLEIYVETGNSPLTLSDVRFEETRYPLDPQTDPFRCSDDLLNQISEMCLRTLQMDCHDTFCDSPYYEQLQYVGDTRIEALMTLLLGIDDRAHRKATLMFDASRSMRGITQSRYPCRSRQYIPPFSLWWVLMVVDYQNWRSDADVARLHLPGIRAVLSSYQMLIDPANGLPRAQEDWNFLDWVPEWNAGIPPGGNEGFNLGFALQLLLAVEATIELESQYGRAQSQRSMLVWAQELRSAVKAQIAPNGLIPDTPGGNSFCEHVHCLGDPH